MDGQRDPHDILRISGEKALAAYLVDEVQEVYRLQGVTINDKHIELIVRQMLRKVEITDPGGTDYFAGRQVDRYELREANQKAASEGKEPAQFAPLLLGITKTSLNTQSWISAASFQETSRILTEAAAQSRVDKLKGLKENVIMGRLIPAGTGFKAYQNRSVYCEPPPEEEEEEEEFAEEALYQEAASPAQASPPPASPQTGSPEARPFSSGSNGESSQS